MEILGIGSFWKILQYKTFCLWRRFLFQNLIEKETYLSFDECLVKDFDFCGKGIGLNNASLYCTRCTGVVTCEVQLYKTKKR